MDPWANLIQALVDVAKLPEEHPEMMVQKVEKPAIPGPVLHPCPHCGEPTHEIGRRTFSMSRVLQVSRHCVNAACPHFRIGMLETTSLVR
jgi:hypothetical protein